MQIFEDHQDGDAATRVFLDVGSLPRLPSRRWPWILLLIAKGGGGKSTTAINLAAMAQVAGNPVGLIDLDHLQMSLSLWRNVRILNLPRVQTSTPKDLRANLQRAAKEGIDLVIIDTSGAPDGCPPEVAKLADFTLVITKVGKFDVSATRQRAKWLATLGVPYAIVLNDTQPLRRGNQSIPHRVAMADLTGAGAVWRGQITHKNSIMNAIAAGSNCFEQDPSDPATHEYARLWRAIVNQMKELADGNQN